MNTGVILIIVLILLVLTTLGILAWQNQEVIIKVERDYYHNGGSLRLKLRNYSLKEICFSGCYPYFLETKRTETWQAYSYEECPFLNTAERCLKPLGTKFFEVALPEVEKGIHRLAIPVCLGCRSGGEFRESKRLYSAEFEIK